MSPRPAQVAVEAIVLRITVKQPPQPGRMRAPRGSRDSLLLEIVSGAGATPGTWIEVPRKHARGPMAVGDRAYLVWPGDSRRSWPDIYPVRAHPPTGAAG